jgi:transposase InsO family protein
MIVTCKTTECGTATVTPQVEGEEDKESEPVMVDSRGRLYRAIPIEHFPVNYQPHIRAEIHALYPGETQYRVPLTKAELLGVPIVDDDGTEELLTMSDLLPRSDGKADIELPPVEGEGELYTKVRKMLQSYKDIFRRVVSDRPAQGIDPMKLEVDLDKWRNNKATSNHCRPQTRERERAIEEHIRTMLTLGVIEESQAQNFSQVHLEPKPDGSWRFTVDYRILNECSRVNQGFPLPNIKQLLHRLGTKNAKYWAKIDLTSGFHQTELAEESREFGAFIALGRIYQPTRVFMGLKNAPSYFQRMVATRVLRELVGTICEIYIDDIIVWGATEKEYITNLGKVFNRLREHNVTINPKKVELCLNEVDFLGHLLKPYGITMSKKKIDKVIQFKKPETLSEMHSFLGLANYFREFVAGFEEVAHPLRKLVDQTTEEAHELNPSNSRKLTKRMKQTELEWTPETDKAWEDMKECIANCTTLHFVRDQGKLILFTDASDYAFGAYLCQEDEEKRLVPIALMSHTFNPVQLRWSTYDKEGYAIFKAFQEFKLFIRDRKFTLKTDHRNLLYIGSENSSAKVQRWKLFMQDYDFDVEHIEGAKNVVADGLSRFVNRWEKESIPTTSSVNFLAALRPKEPMTAEQREQIKKVHNALVGHHGVERTVQALENNGAEWIGMRSDVRQFIKECPICQKLTFTRPEVTAELKTLAATRPNQRLYMDTVGPLPPSQDPRRVNPYKFILVIQDAFTRYVDLYALENTDAIEAADCIQHYFASRRFLPDEIITDNGSQFVNVTLEEYFKHLDIARPEILAYSKEENGMVERVNKEAMRHLRAFIYERKVRDIWHRYLLLVQKILNSSPHSATKVAPIQLQFPTVTDDAIELHDYLTSLSKLADENVITEWNKRNVAYYRDLVQIATKLQSDLDQEHLAKMDEAELTLFEDDSWVLAMPHRGRGEHRAQDDKTKSFWSGPYKVMSHLGNTYVVKDMVQDKLLEYHVTSLKKYDHNPANADPVAVAMGDSQEYVVERVVAHEFRQSIAGATEEGRRAKRPRNGHARVRDIFFLIHWQGYPDSADTWEPWSVPGDPTKGVRLVDKVKEYCRAHPDLKHLVSRS